MTIVIGVCSGKFEGRWTKVQFAEASWGNKLKSMKYKDPLKRVPMDCALTFLKLYRTIVYFSRIGA